MRLTKLLFCILVILVLAMVAGCGSEPGMEDITGHSVEQQAEPVVQELVDEPEDTGSGSGERDTEEIVQESEETETGGQTDPEADEEAGETGETAPGSISDKFKTEEKPSPSPAEDIYGGDSAVDVFIFSSSDGDENAKFYIKQIEASTLKGVKEVLFSGDKEVYLVPGMKIRVAKKLVDPASYRQVKIITDHEQAFVITADGEEHPADFSFDFEKGLDRNLESGETLAIAFDLKLDRSIESKSRASQTNEYVINPNGLRIYVDTFAGIDPDFEDGPMSDSDFEDLGFELTNDMFSVNPEKYK